jgi:hypothetical protein
MNHDNNEYTDDFADISNRQLLLNIARVASDEPAYFLQMGNFTAGYTYTGTTSIGGTGTSFTHQVGGGTPATATTTTTTAAPSTVATNSVSTGGATTGGGSTGGGSPTPTATSSIATTTAGAMTAAADTMNARAIPTATWGLVAPSLGLTYTSNPSYTFVPLSGDQVTKALFAPLQGSVFSVIFLNWHADVAIRTAAQSIILLPPKANASEAAPLIITGVTPKDKVADDKVAPPLLPAACLDSVQIKTQPEGQTITSGKDATFVIGAVAEKATYQWQIIRPGKDKSGDDYDWQDLHDVSGGDSRLSIKGSTSSTLTLSNVPDKLAGSFVRCLVRVTNSPIILENDPRDPSYPYFIALAYEVNKAQREAKIPWLGDKSDIQKQADAAAEAGAKAGAVTISKVKISDILAADAAGYKVVNSSGGAKDSFLLYKNSPPQNAQEYSFPPLDQLGDYPLLNWMVANGWSLSTSLRSFDNVLYQVAREKQRWHDLGSTGRSFLPANVVLPVVNARLETPSEPEDMAGGDFLKIKDGDMTIKVHPLLRILPAEYMPSNPLVELYHLQNGKRQHFVVGDVKGEKYFDPSRPDEGWTPSIGNNTEFTLLAYLFSQASIDSSKLPIQQLIDVR